MLSVCNLQLPGRRRRDDAGGGQSTSESEAESDFEQTVSSYHLMMTSLLRLIAGFQTVSCINL